MGKDSHGLKGYFETENGQYLTGKIRDVDVKPITHNPGYVVEYALKGLVKRTVSPDDVLVLNWGGSASRPDTMRENMRRFSRWIGLSGCLAITDKFSPAPRIAVYTQIPSLIPILPHI